MSGPDPVGAHYGITIPFDGLPLHAHRQWYARLHELGYTDLWSAEVDGADEAARAAQGQAREGADGGAMRWNGVRVNLQYGRVRCGHARRWRGRPPQ